MWLWSTIPIRRELPDGVPDQNAVEQAKKRRDQAESRRAEIQEEYQKAAAALAAEKKALGEDPPAYEEAKAQLAGAGERTGQPEGGRCAGAGTAPEMCGREPPESRTA